MRNLRNVRLAEAQLPYGLPLTASAWDAGNDSIVCAFGPTEEQPVIELKRRNTDEVASFVEIASWDAPCPLPDLASDRILSLQYFADTLIACLVLEGGDIIVVREDPEPGEDKIEIVGSVDEGITAAAWSPDEELLAVTTRAGTLLYMTRSFENVSAVTFTPGDLAASKHVSVGWGKKETQFQGKRAKAMRDPTMPEKVDEGVISSFDDEKVTISWRGDGAFLAVNRIEPGHRRVIRVYSREGVLDSVSEPVDNLEGALSWRPAGNLMACVQRFESRIDVVFFERNGLRHGEFTLRLTSEEMQTWAANIDLYWNIDSTVLAVCFKDRIQLWTMGNYHYYLKQEMLFERQMNTFASFKWHPEKAIRLTTSSQESLFDLDWVFDVSAGSTVSPNDHGLVGVIDGRTLKLTPLRLVNIAPPMAHCEITVDEPIVDAAFSASGTKIAVLTQAGVALFDWDLSTKPVPEPTLIETLPFNRVKGARSRQVVFYEDQVVVLRQLQAEGSAVAQYLPGQKIFFTNYQTMEGDYIDTLSSDVGNHRVWISNKTTTGTKIFHFLPNDESSIQNSTTVEEFDSQSGDAPWIKAITSEANEHILFSLSRTGILSASKRQIARNCSSFAVTPSHLVYTTTSHLLKFVHISNVDDMEIPADTPETDERCRSIERGARLIHVMPKAYALVMQMPRGNIETIYPRALVLAGIRAAIDAKKYKTAFIACQKHMVDMNILHDYAPTQFMENVGLFIDQLKKVDRIDDFLSKLKEEDVSQTLYRDTLRAAGADVDTNAAQTSSQTAEKPSKVNAICDAFLEVLKNKMSTNLQNLVTAYVCKRPADLTSGLQLVARLRQENQEQAEQAIEHMVWLSDVNRLFDNALGLYDLDLALLVAQQSQKDPREYLPFLQRLQDLPLLRRHFEIDDHLKRNTKALADLHELQAYDELKSYAVKHELYKEALGLYKYDEPRLREMTHIYADHLSTNSKHKHAALAYESLSLWAPATQSYKLAHLWRESLFCASMIPLPDSEMTELANDLATTLTDEAKDYISAATIHAEHLHDLDTAARLLCKGYAFNDAMRLLALHNQSDKLPTLIDTGLTDAMSSTLELLSDCKSQINAQVPRIAELRLKKLQDPLAYFGGDAAAANAAGADIDIPDNVSLAPTDTATTAGGTLFTRYSRQSGTTGTGVTGASKKTSSRTRRREERKRARGKKGSVYEEEYLVNSVGRLIERVNSAAEEVGKLVVGLVRRGMRERAEIVEKNMLEVVGLCESAVREVWVNDQTKTEEKKGGENPDGAGEGERPGGGEGVMWDHEQAQRQGSVAPVVKSFRKMGLLGGDI